MFCWLKSGFVDTCLCKLLTLEIKGKSQLGEICSINLTKNHKVKFQSVSQYLWWLNIRFCRYLPVVIVEQNGRQTYHIARTVPKSHLNLFLICKTKHTYPKVSRRK
jgi:hypothetical protein